MANHPWATQQAAFQHAVRRARVRNGLTQAALAKKLGKPQSYVSKYENGERRLDYLEVRQICACCGTTIAAFERMMQTRK